LLKGYNCINGPRRCAFKIDIQKAYDTVSSEFIKDIMGRFGFPCKMIDCIMTCISTPKFTIRVNGERYGYFKGERGLRQGDPIFLIFSLCLNEDDKIEISSIIPFKEDELPMRYLGVHLVTKKIGVTDCRVRQKLSDWKNKALSYAGRAQLIASVLGSMQVYWCYVFLLPKAVMNDIEKLFKNFIWNNGDNYKGKEKVAWLEVCKPNDQGWLGFKSLELWNKTLLVKHLWNIASRKESLWVKWVNVVKLKNRSVWDVLILKIVGAGNVFLILEVGLGIICDTRLGIDIAFDRDKLIGVLGDNGWKWPQQWFIKYPWLANIQVPILSNHKDKAIWVDNNGSEKRFTTNIVWKDVRGSSGKVSWFPGVKGKRDWYGVLIQFGHGWSRFPRVKGKRDYLWPFLYCGCWLSVVKVPWIGKCSQEGMVLVNNGEQSELSVSYLKYFKFQANDSSVEFPSTITSSRLDVCDRDSLEADVSMEEIKMAVWGCGSEKAPGPDGYTFAFVKKYWDLLKANIFDFVSSFLSTGKMPPGSNSSFITLIPKVSNPILITHF
ncbi:RNA-directed DNA polymerase, eukaryota, reverse transcriptase zinc-binding domain protein, partial [Tanacetum coccineum]